MVNILVTGGSGMLGSTLVPLLKNMDGDGTMFPRVNVIAPSHDEFDILRPNYIECDMVVHCAAYTNTLTAEHEKRKCSLINIEGTLRLLKTYYDKKFVFISSEYAINPVNHYGKTKRIGEMIVEVMAQSYLIIRTLFKPRPWPFDKAFADQYTRGDYLDIIVELIAKEIEQWDYTNRLVHLGTERKTMYDLAKRTRPDVRPNSVNNIEGVRIPNDYES